MSIRYVAGVVTVGLIIGCASASADQTVQAVEAKILEAWNKLDALRVKTAMEYFSPDPTKGKPSSFGILAYKKVDGVGKYRVKSTFERPMPDGVITIDYDYLYDGTALYTVTMKGDEVSAVKASLDDLGGPPPGGPFLLKFIKTIFDLAAGPDTEVDGRPVYLLKARAKDSKSGDYEEGRFYFDKKTGLCLRMELGREERGAYVAFHYTDLEVNPTLPADHFIFVPPEGVEVIDMLPKAADSSKPAAAPPKPEAAAEKQPAPGKAASPE